MPKLSAWAREHLLKALQTDDPEQKDFHVRQVLQANDEQIDELIDD